jgi:Mg2+ and Co2+ transporter CorA
VLTSFNASVALVTAITGLFAMNVMLQVLLGQLLHSC